MNSKPPPPKPLESKPEGKPSMKPDKPSGYDSPPVSPTAFTTTSASGTPFRGVKATVQPTEKTSEIRDKSIAKKAQDEMKAAGLVSPGGKATHDSGHAVGLSLGGKDGLDNRVPQVPESNRSGPWRQYEKLTQKEATPTAAPPTPPRIDTSVVWPEKPGQKAPPYITKNEVVTKPDGTQKDYSVTFLNRDKTPLPPAKDLKPGHTATVLPGDFSGVGKKPAPASEPAAPIKPVDKGAVSLTKSPPPTLPAPKPVVTENKPAAPVPAPKPASPPPPPPPSPSKK